MTSIILDGVDSSLGAQEYVNMYALQLFEMRGSHDVVKMKCKMKCMFWTILTDSNSYLVDVDMVPDKWQYRPFFHYHFVLPVLILKMACLFRPQTKKRPHSDTVFR